MALLRDLVAVRRGAGRPLKVVLMSATLDSALFADYFGACPVLHAQVSGSLVVDKQVAAAWTCGWATFMQGSERHRHVASTGGLASSAVHAEVHRCGCRFSALHQADCCGVVLLLDTFLVLQGRTFPVEQLFLEDCYEATGACHAFALSLRPACSSTGPWHYHWP